MSAPVRIQLSRRKGWRMPPNTVKVCRPGPWGNPFIITGKRAPGTRLGSGYIAVPTVEDAVACYREMLAADGPRAEWMRKHLSDLRGKNLACWCKPGDPCHADVLLELANAPEGQP